MMLLSNRQPSFCSKPNHSFVTMNFKAKMFYFAPLNIHANAYRNFIDLENKWTNFLLSDEGL